MQVCGGIIDFDPEKQKDLVGGDKITYDEYLDLQMMACENKGNVRWSFAMCYYYIPLEFMGEIERITEKAVCFKRIYIFGMYLMAFALMARKIMYGLINTVLRDIKLVTVFRSLPNRIATLKPGMVSK